MREMRVPLSPGIHTPYVRTKKHRKMMSRIITRIWNGSYTPKTRLEKMMYQTKWERKYRKTVAGFLATAYHNMRGRVTGVQKARAHLYLGLSILPKEEFYTMSRSDPSFWKLWRDWVASGHSKKLSPSVNRIDPRRGYEISNIEWLSHSENSRLGSLSKRFKEMESIGRMINA